MRDSGTPDIRGPWRYLAWMALRHKRILLLDCLFNMLWAAGLGLTPGVIGLAINSGLVAKNQGALVGWGLAVIGVGLGTALSAMLVERLETRVRVEPAYDTMRLVNRQVYALGGAVGRKVSAGDLVTVGVSDINLIGQTLELGARGVGGGLVGFIVVGVVMLLSSWQAGLLVLVAVPLILFITTRLARTLRSRQRQLRADQRKLTDEAVDIVRGLRVLRGLGGEELFAGRYRDASQRLRVTALGQSRATAVIGATRTLLPGMLLAAVVALAGELVLGGKLRAGQVVAFYGYTTYLSIPTNQITFAVQKAMQGHVAAANVIRLLGIKPDIESASEPGVLPSHGVLADPDSGLRVRAAGLTAVVCPPAEAIALADRLGRHVESEVTYAGVPLAELPLAGVRERILVTTAKEHLFAGPLRRGLDPRDRLGGADDPLWTAIDAAAARDIVEFLPNGLDTDVAAGGRDFSGGQQQRLRLARALIADPEVLILIDPTSAVDANTENQMAEGTARLRDGRATVVFTTSVLLLRRADHVALVLDGTVAAEGSHETLMADERYRSLVERRTVEV